MLGGWPSAHLPMTCHPDTEMKQPTEKGTRVMNTTRRLLAGILIAGVATFASVGVAAAQTTTPTNPSAPTTQTKANRCDKAKDRLGQLDAVRVRAEQRLDQLNKAIADAKAHHRDDVVKRLEARHDQVQKRHDKVVDLINKIHARCGV
jgi:flagellar motility protein MotE (MotC chaperone)